VAVHGEATSVIGVVPAAAPLVKRRPTEPGAVRPATPAPSSPGGQPPPKTKGRKRSRRGPILLGIVLVLAVVAAGTGWYLGVGRYTTTPGVEGMPQAQAQDKIEAAGLKFEVGDQAFSETVTKGAVIATDPKAGDRILDDGTVSATISLGPERHAVPILRGLTVDQAAEELDQANLAVGKITEAFSETVAEDLVIRSTPRAKTELPRDNEVALVVSKGQKPIEIEDYTGRRAKAVEATLTKLGLEVKTEEDFSEDVKKGRVISQDPGPGASLHKGEEIKLVVSKGPPLVEVPNVVTQGEEAARLALEAAGFVVNVQQHPTYIGLGFVYSQEPSGGELPKGSTVTIYLV
jgi:eukaryotic-like serine/threonine-protein kinase